MNKKRWISIAVVILLLVVYLKTDVGEDAAANDWRKNLFASDQYTTETYEQGTGKSIVIIPVEGIIQDQADSIMSGTETYNHQAFLKELEDAFANNQIGAVVLSIDSPGGGVFESDEAYQKILKLKEKYNKPLLVSMGSMAASGGYYIASPADKIFANRNTITGSIGVILSTYNYRELADKIGVHEEVFKSGKNKDLLNPMREVSEEERTIMQSIINESYDYFVDAVAEGRKMDRQAVIKLADGRIYTARQAKAVGLVDEIGDLDATIQSAAKMIGEKDPHVLLFKTVSPYSWERWLSSLANPGLDLLGIKESLDKNSGPSLMYLYRS